MSEAARVLTALAGEDEWERHQVLERLRAHGMAEAALPDLTDALDDDEDASRRTAARMALSALASPESPLRDRAHDVLRAALRSPHDDLRVLAASALGESGNPDAAGDLIGALEDDDPNVIAAAADALGVLGHPVGIAALARLAGSERFWARAAAVVSLGRIADARAIPTLADVARSPGLEEPVIEALRSIGDPAALPLLQELAGRAPLPALLAAGAILCAHPETLAPTWVRPLARAEAAALRERVDRADDPAAARLLGLAGGREDLDMLIDRIIRRSSDAAIGGVLAADPEVRADAILARLAGTEADACVLLLSLLPPLRDEDRIRRLTPLLEDGDPSVRAAAAESLARAPAGRGLPLLQEHLSRGGVAPEVLRAMGGLGSEACAALTPLLADADPGVRAAAADALARCAGPELADRLSRMLAAETEPTVRAALLRAYGHAAGAAAVERLSAALSDPDADVRLAAIEALGATGAPDALDALRSALRAAPPDGLAALRALGDLGQAGGADLLAPSLRSPDRDVRRVAAAAAVALAPHLPPGLAPAMAEDADEWVRLCGVRVLSARGEGGDRLRELAAADPDAGVRTEARRALEGNV